MVRMVLRLVLMALTLLGLLRLGYAGEPVRIDSFTFHSGQAEFRAEGIEFEDLNIAPDGLEALLHGADAAAQAKAIATLDADAIRISRLRETQLVSGQTTVTLFSNVVMTNVRQGLASQIRAGQITFGATGGMGDANSGLAASLALDDVDLAVLVGFGAATKDPKPSEFHRAYRLARIEKIALQSASHSVISIDRIEVQDESFRDIGDGLTAISERLLKAQAKPTPLNDAELVASALDVIDVYSAISTGSFEILGISVKEPEKPTNSASLRRFSYKGGKDTSAYAFEGLDIAVDDFRLTIDRIAQDNINIGLVLESVRKALMKPNAKLADIEPALFTPVIGHIELNNATIDADIDGLRHSGLRHFTFAVDTTPEGSPLALALDFDALTGPLPATSTEPAVQTLMGLGYRYINVSGGLRVTLDPKSQDLTLQSNLSGENMAAVSLTGTFGNIPAANIAAAPTAAPALLLGASVKSFALSVENHGLAERLTDQQAIKTKRPPAEVRSSYAAAAAASLQIYFGMSPNARGLTQSLVTFIGKPDRLMIAAQAKNPAGVSLSDTSAGDGPAAILDLFELQVEPK